MGLSAKQTQIFVFTNMVIFTLAACNSFTPYSDKHGQEGEQRSAVECFNAGGVWNYERKFCTRSNSNREKEKWPEVTKKRN
jgi:hypothetical protein